MSYMLIAKCANDHAQTIHYKEGFTKNMVEGVAGLMDGTSPMYAHSPVGTDSVIGKCGICKAQIKCTVYEVGVDVANGPELTQ